MKKAKIKSALKEIQQELTRMDIRISKLEPSSTHNEPLGFWLYGVFHIHQDFMNEHLPNVKMVSSDETLIDKKTESFHKQASMQKNETELKELPENWCVKYTENQSYIIKCFLKWDILCFNDGYLHKSPDNDYCVYGRKQNDYTEISFSDFERLVLKKEQKEETVKLQVGEWYTDLGGTSVVCITKLPDIDNENLTGYGLDNSVWFNDNNIKNEPIWLKCDLYHVRDALINYAKPTYGDGDYIIEGGNGDWYFSKGFKLLMHNGIWMHEVETSKEQPKEIDWSVPMLVESESYIVQTNGEHGVIGENCFSGFVIKIKNGSQKKGYFTNNWSKKAFTNLTDPITINND